MSNDVVEEPPGNSRFLTGLEFLTGDDPSAGSFLLVVGMVTCVFIAVFQFTLPDPISTLLTALVIVVAVLSFIMGAILDILGHFDSPTETR
jgi:divalent metal cation (Fe/Co/Zn/Cd) transporter